MKFSSRELNRKSSGFKTGEDDDLGFVLLSGGGGQIGRAPRGPHNLTHQTCREGFEMETYKNLKI